ncbi:MAG: MBL fold metallo-hydrolase RNA specificity domain-containing protein [Planctomycetaceae bacterium]
MKLVHHGAYDGVTGSCHQYWTSQERSLLVDCGTFQGQDAHRHPNPEIRFSLEGIEALLLTHVHIDHVGRVPYLLGAGFRKPIYCSLPTAKLLPLVMEDALRIGFTKNRRAIDFFLRHIDELLAPLHYGQWHEIADGAKIRLQPAGHVLGSTYFEVQSKDGFRAVFSGDLGPKESPLLNPPRSPERADLLVLESTYGDRLHPPLVNRQQELEAILCKTLHDGGVTIIPAFSLGRTQDLLLEMNNIFERLSGESLCEQIKHVRVIVDSPLASRYTEIYNSLTHFWGDEAKRVLSIDDQPLVFHNLETIGGHQQHLGVVEHLCDSHQPAVVIAGSGMCSGGRVVNYLKKFLGRKQTDIVFVGYQASGTPGHYIQQAGDWVRLDGKRFEIHASTHTISGYSAHADQADLIRFVEGMQERPSQIRLVHGEYLAKKTLTEELSRRGYVVD